MGYFPHRFDIVIILQENYRVKANRKIAAEPIFDIGPWRTKWHDTVVHAVLNLQ
jgi:hypothetical protein